VFDILNHECQAQRNRCIGDVAAACSRRELLGDVAPSRSLLMPANDASAPARRRASLSGCQSDIGADSSRSLEACRIVDRRLEAERGDRADTRHGHQPADPHIVTRQRQNLTVEIADLLLDGPARDKQWPDRSNQLGTVSRSTPRLARQRH
jgi:hypothetical protein